LAGTDYTLAGGALVGCALEGIRKVPMSSDGDWDLWAQPAMPPSSWSRESLFTVFSMPLVKNIQDRGPFILCRERRTEDGKEPKKPKHGYQQWGILLPELGLQFSMCASSEAVVGAFDLDFVRALYHPKRGLFLSLECAQAWVSGTVSRAWCKDIHPHRLAKVQEKGFAVSDELRKLVMKGDGKTRGEPTGMVVPRMSTERAFDWLTAMYDGKYSFHLEKQQPKSQASKRKEEEEEEGADEVRREPKKHKIDWPAIESEEEEVNSFV
jgi:hypothetical protein